MNAKLTSLMITALAAMGWLLAGYLLSEAHDIRDQMVQALQRAEIARSGLIVDFQILQVASGHLE